MIPWPLLPLLWYLVVGVCALFYVVLDGFDLGVGLLHLFAKKDEERRVFLNAIGPVWDGNEVWLVVVGGALFAGFPEAYATIFSGFYDLCMLLLLGLVFRAVAIECRSKQYAHWWRTSWDIAFFVASFIIAYGLGVTLGCFIQGVPIDAHKTFIGTFEHVFTPYSLLMGFFVCVLFATHGTLFLAMKTEGELMERICRWSERATRIFAVLFCGVTAITWVYIPHMTRRFVEHPGLLSLGALVVGCFWAIPYLARRRLTGWAFICSSCGIITLFLICAIGFFPMILRSSLNPEHYSLTFENCASSPLTLKILLTIVAIGIPLVLAYGGMAYRIFRGKVHIDHTSY